MTYMVARFDLDETRRVPNTPRITPKGVVLPVDFPFVVDDQTGEAPEPILLHLRNKFYSPAMRGPRWPLKNSADAAAADLKAWWINLASKGRRWDNVNDRFLAEYLTDLRSDVSGHTLNYVSDATFRRRLSTISEFYKFAVSRWALTTYPSIVNARMISDSDSSGRSKMNIEQTDSDPHPIEDKHVDLIAEALGPLPDVREEKQSSRNRLAFELGLNVGLRIDEIVNLRASMFIAPAGDDPDTALRLRITHTKGLRPRTVYFPNDVVRQIKHYIGNEREGCLAAARRTWLKGSQKPPLQLLLNQADAGANAGKKVRTATIEEAFSHAVAAVGIPPTERHVAKNTEFERVDFFPRYVFHDTRHTYALWTFESFASAPATKMNGAPRFDEAIAYVQRRLGHRHSDTTKKVYLDVFSDLATTAIERLMQDYRRRRTAVLGGRR